jgi:glycosyltransferase involved in cell wall biosynthesis
MERNSANRTERAWPRISIVTPSFNRAAFLEETIRSVLDQNYPDLEYIIVDGSSTDESVEIIRRYQDRLAWWVSEPDHGPYDAINKGFARATGEIMAWIGSDDKYLPWTFKAVAEAISASPQIEWITSLFHLFFDEQGPPIHCEIHDGFSRRMVLRGGTLPGCGWPAACFLQQESTFWRRSLWARTGGKLEGETYPLAADYDLWMRFAAEAEIYSIPVPLAGFRQHPDQLTARSMQEYLRQSRLSFFSHGGRPPGRIRSFWLKKTAKLLRYLKRRQAFAMAQQGFFNRLELSPNGPWELKRY